MALDPLISYYQRELTYLRRAGSEFAKKHPKVARRLDLSLNESADPHVERLIESFAYLSGILQQDIDNHFPRVTSALLGVLYPHLINPVPSMSIAQFKINPDQGKHTTGYEVYANNPVFSRTQEGDLCQFRTKYPIELWPMQVDEAEIINRDTLGYSLSHISSTRVLRIRIKAMTLPFSKLGGPRKIRFYLNGDRSLQNTLYEMLFTEDPAVYVIPNIAELNNLDEARNIKAGPIKAVGFKSDEEVLPTKAPAHPAYRLLQEYFNFPQKFMFFDIENIPCFQCENSFDIVISIPDKVKLEKMPVDKNTFLLGCTPIINLYKKTSEPIKLDYRTHEYRLVADYRRELITEIYSVEKVLYIAEGETKPHVLAPYFSYSHYEEEQANPLMWYARRDKTISPEIPGTDIYLSFVNFSFEPESPPSDTVYAELLCTNRILAQQMPAGSKMEADYPIPLTVTCLEQPTMQMYPPEDADTQWRLISHLSLNHLPLKDGTHALKALKEILHQYASLGQIQNHPEIQGLENLASQRIVRRFVEEAWRGFSQGTKIELTFNRDIFGAGGALLFSNVLNEFFALYAAVNSFVELSIINQETNEVWKSWQPNRGDNFLL